MKPQLAGLIVALLLLAAWAAPAVDADVKRLAGFLTGRFASTAQAAADPEYFDVRLHSARIWPDRDDGIWLYVEQAMATALDRPYRQRVYRVFRRDDGKLISAVYTLRDPASAVGAWKQDAPLAGLSVDDLELRAGCEMVLETKEDGFTGGTVGRNCPSDLRGAAYATSQAVIDARGMRTWDRGYTADGQQVWGAVKGPYQFDRIP